MRHAVAKVRFSPTYRAGHCKRDTRIHHPIFMFQSPKEGMEASKDKAVHGIHPMLIDTHTATTYLGD